MMCPRDPHISIKVVQASHAEFYTNPRALLPPIRLYYRREETVSYILLSLYDPRAPL